MNATTASFLIKASSRCILISDVARSVPTSMPTAEDLLLLEMCGGRTVPRGDGTAWQFSMDMMMDAVLDGVLSEDPDVVASKYRRADYEFFAFGGDANGGAIAPNVPHSTLFRGLINDGAVVRGMGFSRFAKYSASEPTVVVGKPMQYLNSHAGVILPKQGGVDGTYISFWQSRDDWPVAWAKQHFDGPFFAEIELPTGGWDLHGHGRVIPV